MELFEDLWESVSRQPLRTAMAAFGVFWGMLVLIVLLGASNGLGNGLERLFRDEAATSVWIDASKTTTSHKGLPSGRSIELTIDDVHALTGAVPGLRSLSPRHPLPAEIVLSHKGRRGSLPVFGIYPGYAAVERTEVSSGRLLNDLDVKNARKVAVLGERAAEALFARPETAVGQRIDIGGEPFLVVGVFRDAGGDAEMRRVFVPYAVLPRTFDASRRAATITGIADPTVSPALLRSRVARILAARHHFAPDDYGAVEVWVAMEERGDITAFPRGVRIGVLFFGLGILLTAMSGLSNILLVSVRERTTELGLRRALGVSANHIFTLVVAEAVLIGGACGALGAAVGLALLRLARDLGFQTHYFQNPAVELGGTLPLLALLLLASAIAGTFPARLAVRLSSAEALRHV